MKKILIALVVFVSAFTGFTAKADGGGYYGGSFTNWTSSCTNFPGGTNYWGIYTNVWNTFSNYWSGCSNLLNSRYHEGCAQVITLSATTNAPDGAAATASLRAEGDDEGEAAIIKVHISGLNPDAYNVSIADVTGTNSYTLGTVNVATNSNLCRSDDQDETDDDDNATNAIPSGTNTVATGRASFPVPAGLDPTNVASIFIFDTNDVVLLTGNFNGQTNLAAVYYCETVAITPGTSSNVRGQGTLTLSWKKGKTAGTFTLNANGLPAKKTLYLKANGANSATANTGTKGTVSVKNLPHVNLPDLQTVEARDKQGKTVFHLEF